ncbi:MAG: hypothetical protein ACRDFB_00860, partial [Rhabdochlamydiaceae bacterium]
MCTPVIAPVIANPLKQLTQAQIISKTSDDENYYNALIVQAANVYIIVFRKDLCVNSTLKRYSSNFTTLKCWVNKKKYAILQVPRPYSLETIGIVVYGTQDQAKGSLEEFWKGSLFIAEGVAMRMLSNQFHPSPELQEGFHYQEKCLIIRGHAKHVSGEESALTELQNQFESLVKRMIDGYPRVGSSIKSYFETENVKSVFRDFNQKKFNIDALDQEIQQKLKQLFGLAEKVSNFRLYEKNPDTDRDIQTKKMEATTAIESLNRVVQQACSLQDIKIEDVEALQEGIDAYQKQVAALRAAVVDSFKVTEREGIYEYWSQKLGEFRRIVVDDQVTTANGPIVRVYQEMPISTLDSLKIACWHLLVLLIEHNYNPSQDLYLSDTKYRESLIFLLEKEWNFYKKLDETVVPPALDLPTLKEAIEQLKSINTYFLSFEALT